MCCTCWPVATFDPLCPIHGDRDPIKILLDRAETPLPRRGGDTETCICRIVDEPPGTAELAIHEDCPIHWRQAADE